MRTDSHAPKKFRCGLYLTEVEEINRALREARWLMVATGSYRDQRAWTERHQLTGSASSMEDVHDWRKFKPIHPAWISNRPIGSQQYLLNARELRWALRRPEAPYIVNVHQYNEDGGTFFATCSELLGLRTGVTFDKEAEMLKDLPVLVRGITRNPAAAVKLVWPAKEIML